MPSRVCAVGSADAPTRPRRSTSASSASARSRSSTTTTPLRPTRLARLDRRRARRRSGATRDLLPAASSAPVDLGAGFTPLVRADRLAAELGLGELWLKDDTRNPTGSFKDRVVSVALTKARELGFKVAACASTGNLANSVAAHAARAGMESYVFVPSDLERGEDRDDRGLRGPPHRRRRHLRRREPALRRARERASRLGLRQRQRPPVLRGGLQDPRLRGRRAARLAAPDHVVVPIASGSQLTKIHKGFHELNELGLIDDGDDGADLGRAGRGLRARGDRLRDGRRPRSGRCGPTRSPSRSRSATRPTAGTRSRWCARAAARSRRSPTPRSSRRSVCWPGPRGSSPRPPAASRSRRSPSSPHAGVVRRDERVVAYITGNGLKTVEALGGTVGPVGDHRPDARGLRRSSKPRTRGGSQTMSVTVRIPTQLRPLTGGEGEIAVEATTVARGDRRARRRAPRRRASGSSTRTASCGAS